MFFNEFVSYWGLCQQEKCIITNHYKNMFIWNNFLYLIIFFQNFLFKICDYFVSFFFQIMFQLVFSLIFCHLSHDLIQNHICFQGIGGTRSKRNAFMNAFLFWGTRQERSASIFKRNGGRNGQGETPPFLFAFLLCDISKKFIFFSKNCLKFFSKFKKSLEKFFLSLQKR